MANTQAIDHVLRQAVQAHDVPGVVAMAATDQGVMYEGAFGSARTRERRGHDARYGRLDRLDDQSHHVRCRHAARRTWPTAARLPGG